MITFILLSSLDGLLHGLDLPELKTKQITQEIERVIHSEILQFLSLLGHLSRVREDQVFGLLVDVFDEDGLFVLRQHDGVAHIYL
jgi:hypothetical protein